MFLRFLSLCFCSLLWLSSFSQSEFVPGELIVQLPFGYSQENFVREAQKQSAGIVPLRALSKRFNIWLFQTAAGTEQATIEKLRRLQKADLIQLNHKVQLRETVPNDPNFTQQWALKNTGQSGGTVGADIDATLAWDITTGGISTLGDTIVVAVIDGGFQITHPDLQQNIFRNWDEIAGNNIDDDGNGYIDDVNGWNAYDDNGVIPVSNHGTHVSGIVSARGNNGTGVSGVNWAAKVLPISGSSGDEATVVAAYAYAAEMRIQYDQTNGQKGAFVVSTNSSFGVDLGDPSEFPIWCAFYDTLGSYGILSAGATANANYNIDTQGDIPTACASEFLVSVTNSTRADIKYASAGYGVVSIDIASPGTDIYSTTQNSNYGNLTGTSMATPLVAGSIGLMYAAACPQLIEEYKANPANVALQMRNYLFNGADVLPAMDGLVNGSRRLNLLGAVAGVQSYICDPNSPPLASFSSQGNSGCPGINVAFFNNSSSNADSFVWQFQGGSPASSTAEEPIITYGEFGSYDVTLIAINEFGSDTVEFQNYVSVTNTGTKVVFNETFESADFEATGWTVENPDNQNGWELYTTAGSVPGTRSAGINIFNNQNREGQRDLITSPVISFAETSNNQLTFEHAHRRRIQAQQDTLIILVTIDNGNNWQRVSTLAGPGSLATAGLLSSNFVPANSDDWCTTGDIGVDCYTFDLSEFDGVDSLRLRFEVYNDAGNNIYLDNINISGICTAPVLLPTVAAYAAATAVICEGVPVQFNNQSENASQFDWTFNGPEVQTSTADNPVITFNSTGIYSVTLIASNSQFSDTLVSPDVVIVNAVPPPPTVTASGNNLTTGSPFELQWYLNGFEIAGENSTTFSALESGVYTVTATNNEGCSSTSAPEIVVFNGINDANQAGFTVFPNPAKEFLIVEFKGIGNWNADLTDASGRLIWTKKEISSDKELISFTDLNSGIYFIRMISDKGTVVKKIIH